MKFQIIELQRGAAEGVLEFRDRVCAVLGTHVDDKIVSCVPDEHELRYFITLKKNAWVGR